MCARHGLQRSDLQEHADVLGFDIGTIDDDAVHVEQVQGVFPSQLSRAWYKMQCIPRMPVISLQRPLGRFCDAAP